jgi:hypothetical protein
MTPQKKYGVSNPHKIRAHGILNMAIKKGIVRRTDACEECGTIPAAGTDGRSGLHGHHAWGYDLPLKVKWVCARCHKAMDRTTPGALNGRAKLTAADVAKIRKRYRSGAKWWNAEGGAKTLAREFGVSDRTIRRIVRREIWSGFALAPASSGTGQISSVAVKLSPEVAGGQENEDGPHASNLGLGEDAS